MKKLIIIFAVLSLVGCHHVKKRDMEVAKSKQTYRYERAGLAVMAQEGRDAEQLLVTVVNDIATGSPNLAVDLARLDAVLRDVRNINAGTQTVDKNVATSAKDYDAAIKRAELAESEREKLLYKWLVIFIIGGTILTAAGIAMRGAATAYPMIPLLGAGENIAVFGGLLAGISIAIWAVGPYRWIAGIVIVIAICCGVVWYAYQGIKYFRVSRNACKLEKAVVQIVDTGEKVRARDDVATDAIIEEGQKAQDLETQTIVANAKASLRVQDQPQNECPQPAAVVEGNPQ